MKKNTIVSSPKVGMNRTTHGSLLKQEEYSFALNANNTTEQGERLNITNEPSNILAVQFPQDYKVVGYKYNSILNKTYLLLTNPITNYSSIGYIDYNFDYQYTQDQLVDCGDCFDNILQLGTPLENITQIANQSYVELLNDSCNGDLKFDINYPFLTIEIKTEKNHNVMYFTNGKNGGYYINLSDIDYYKYEGEYVCGVDTLPTTCVDVSKMMIFPSHRILQIEPKAILNTGNLKLGTYTFYSSYCDELGNEITNYGTPTNPIKIFDENNFILEQSDLDAQTNFAIKLKINNLDTQNFKYYKIIVQEISTVTKGYSYFVVGIYPTTNDTVLYSSNLEKERTSVDFIKTVKPIYETVDKLVASNNTLFLYGLKQKRQINLQPVVNLFSSLLKWNVSIAKEKLYKDGLKSSLYGGYRRDEVQPFSIRFRFKTGEVSPLYPFIGRPATADDLAIVDTEDVNYQSITEYNTSCEQNERKRKRTRKWQLFNTASITDTCDTPPGGGLTVTEDYTRTCSINNVAEIEEGFTSFVVPVGYTTFKDYLNEYKDEVSNPSSDKYIASIAPYLTDTYPDDNCTPIFQGNDCTTPILQSSSVEIGNITGEVISYTAKTESEYQKSSKPRFCSDYLIDSTTGNKTEDTDFKSTYFPCSTDTVYKRNEDYLENEDCADVIELVNYTTNQTNVQGYYNNYFGGATLADLKTTKDAFLTGTGFTNKVHKKGTWYKINRNNRDALVFEITKKTTCPTTEAFTPANEVRYTFFANCSSTTPLGGGIVNLTTGKIVILNDLTIFPTNNFYVVIDVPYVQVDVPNDCLTPVVTTAKYILTPPCGCYGLLTRDVEYSGAKVDWDTITIDKKQTYTSTCTTTFPQVGDCDVIPYLKGEFAYWESTEEYPNNAELYDSSNLVILNSDLTLTSDDKTRFRNNYIDAVVNNVYQLNQTKTDFRCKRIRHFKMPNSRVVPFMYNNPLPEFSETYIFPLGVELDSSIVRTILNVALRNNLLTQEEYNNIDSYEILRGDTTVSRSVLASGLLYDMFSYQENGKDVLYSNYPHNDLHEDKLHYRDNNRNSFIPHPHQASGNNKFSFISPDIFQGTIINPSEVSIDGYQLGNSRGSFQPVEGHPKWVILTAKGRDTATILGVAEAALEAAAKIAELTINGVGQSWQFGGGGTPGWGIYGGNVVGNGLSAGALAVYVGVSIVNAFTKAGQYRYEWLKILRDLGQPKNFSSYYVSEGYYNNFIVDYENDNSILRAITSTKYLKDGRYSFLDEKQGDKIHVNNWLREHSQFISFGDYNLNYPTALRTYDNSRVIAYDFGCNLSEQSRFVLNPYVTLKNYVPDQHGTIDSVNWLTTNYIRKLSDNTVCDPIFGGTVYISRFTWKRKLPLFKSTAMGEPNMLPFSYSLNPNIGVPRYYCDYETGGDVDVLTAVFPDIRTKDDMDCDSNQRFYKVEPSKFYLYYYGIANFLVESEINCNFRYGRKDKHDQFFPAVGDMVEWTQEKNTTIKEPNTFFYNNIYSQSVFSTKYTILDRTWSSAQDEIRRTQENGVIYSMEDRSENDIIDPWLIYKPFNWYEFPKKYGKLIHLKDLESAQVLGRFENQMVFFNAIDTVQKNTNLTLTQVVGTGGIFAQRPLEFKATDLGFAGTQHTDMVSTPYGHFTVDAKRGKIFQLDSNGKDLQPISDIIGGKESGMKQWFKENLPFKILKYIPNLDIDNKFKGVGITMGWDAKYERVFITKRDYILKQGVNKADFEITKDKKIIYQNEEVFFTNTDLFEDISWTISYKVSDGVWLSYYSFTPNFYIGLNDHFQTYHSDEIWSHLLTNQSFCVFYGKKEPFIIEVPIVNENANKVLESVKMEIESKRYQNKWDFTQLKDIGFNKSIIYNNTNNSGLLNLKQRKSLKEQVKYPITNNDNSQDILYTSQDGEHTFNYFYNRVINQDSNIPQWLNDINKINKTINPLSVNFNFKKKLNERLRGDYFYVRLIKDDDSRYNVILRNLMFNEQLSQ